MAGPPKPIAGSHGLRLFLYRTRGLWLLASVVLALVLTGVLDAGVPVWAWGALLAAVVAATALRLWAAGYIGAPVRGAAAVAETLVTAGPYAFSRNPLYVGNLAGTLALTGMSGLWYAPLIALGAWVVVYAAVIPYEERFLRERFGEAYERYRRDVPLLFPAPRPYAVRSGRFDLRRGLGAEGSSAALTAVFAALFLVLG